MTHALLAAALPYLISAAVYARRGFRASLKMLVVSPAVMLVVATWALVPDIPRALGRDALYYRMHRSPKSDLFFFHHSIDAIEGTVLWPYSVGCVLIALSLLAVAWRELVLRERETPSRRTS